MNISIIKLFFVNVRFPLVQYVMDSCWSEKKIVTSFGINSNLVGPKSRVYESMSVLSDFSIDSVLIIGYLIGLNWKC